MIKQIKLLCEKLNANSVSIVYTQCNRNVINPKIRKAWQPWQVTIRHLDNSQSFFGFRKTAQEAIDSAIKETKISTDR